MGQIGTDRKLELVRRVRLEQHQNRNTLSNREYLLYGKPRQPTPKSELYGLEAAALAGAPKEKAGQLDAKPLKSFKMRLLIAVILFAVYIFIDQAGLSLWRIDSASIHGFINNGFDELTGYFTDLIN
ncbi:MAG: hypothetical protein FWG91_08470 [Lachnospiraceae bacterium]|nr:hypothetical protein [Lachnospiraceae bacterium]